MLDGLAEADDLAGWTGEAGAAAAARDQLAALLPIQERTKDFPHVSEG